jgi:transketolase
LPWLNKIDTSWLMSEIGNVRKIYTLDNHLLKGGQGEMIGSILAEQGFSLQSFKRLGIEGIPACGESREVLNFHGLDSKNIIDCVLGSK